MKRRSSQEYVSKLLELIESADIEQMNQALNLLEPAFDGGLLTQVEFQNLSNTLVAEFYNLCKQAQKYLKFEEWSLALQFGLKLVDERLLSQRGWDKQEELYMEQITDSFLYRYSLRGLSQAGILPYRLLLATTSDGKFIVETYRAVNLNGNNLRVLYTGAAIYKDGKTVHPDARVSDFVEFEIPPIESIYQTEEEYFDLITKEVRRLDKEIEDNFEDLVKNKRRFDKVLKRNMIVATSKSVVAEYMKSANFVDKILYLIEQGGSSAIQGEELAIPLFKSGQISKKDWHRIQLALLGLRLEEAELDYDDTHGYRDVKFFKLFYGDLTFYIPMVLDYSPINNTDMEVGLFADFDRELQYNRLRDGAFESGSTEDYSWLSRASVKSVITFTVKDDVLDIEEAIKKERKQLEKSFEKNAVKILDKNVSELYFSDWY